MNDRPTSIFDAEEKIVEHAQAVLNDGQVHPNVLKEEFASLFRSYKRMFNQLRRLIQLSDSQQLRLNELNQKLDVANRFIRKTFGRYLSDQVVDTILETPEGLKLGGEKRRITVMMTDLRGFTAISERLPAEDVVKIINTYFEVMTDIIYKYHGTIDGFIGDAILAIFGAPVPCGDHAELCVACALEMQSAMKEVNERNRHAGYPEIIMGIGINTGDAVVGNIGSSKRMQYSVIGSTVNLTSRIESYTVGGQILISKTTLDACGNLLRIDDHIEVMPKGMKEPLTVYDVSGIGGRFGIYLPKKTIELTELRPPLPVKFAILEGKQTGETLYDGSIIKLNHPVAEICSPRKCRNHTNLKILLSDPKDKDILHDLYGKITAQSSENPPVFRVHFTFVPPEAERLFRQLCLGNIPG